jgi:hypothetical protein
VGAEHAPEFYDEAGEQPVGSETFFMKKDWRRNRWYGLIFGFLCELAASSSEGVVTRSGASVPPRFCRVLISVGFWSGRAKHVVAILI